MQFTDSVCPTVHSRDALYGKTRSLQANYNLKIITVNFLLLEPLLQNTYSSGCFLFHGSARGQASYNLLDLWVSIRDVGTIIFYR